MMGHIEQVLSADDFMPHGMCYLWQPGILGLHVVSDSLITLAYFSIPFTLLYFVRKRSDLQFNWMFVCFAIFIVACGTTHLMEIWTIWHATYWLSGSIKAITALASVPTAILLIKLVPDALRLPTPAALQNANIELAHEVAERKRAEDEVRKMNELLEARVLERTAEVQAVNRQLSQEARERHHAQETARSSAHLLQAIIDNSLAVIYAKDLEGRYILVNRRFEDIFHHSSASVLGRTDHEFFSKTNAEAFRAMDQRVATAGCALTEEETVPQSDGPHTYVSVKCPLRDAAGNTYGVFGVSTDITERKRTEEALRESEERFRTLAEMLPHLVWTCRPDGWCDYLSRQWVQYTGGSQEEQLGSGWIQQLHPSDHERVRAAWTDATERGDAFDLEFQIRRADGAYRWFKMRAIPIRDRAGHIVKWFGSNTDIHDYKLSEQRLRTQLERLALLDRTTRAIAGRQDPHSILQVVIRSLEDNLSIDFGCVCLRQSATALTVASVGTKSQPLASQLAMAEHAEIEIDQNGLARCMLGQLVYEPNITGSAFVFPRRLADAGMGSLVIAPLVVESKVFGAVVAARCDVGQFSSGDCEFLRQLSEHVALALHQAELYSALQGAYDDLRQTQQGMVQQERLRALGQMASGIAHDINNAMSPASLYTESILEHEPNLSERARAYLTNIQRAIDDVAATVARMREFYRPRGPQLELARIGVNRILSQVVELTRARWSDVPQQRGIVVELRTELADELPPIMGAEAEIRDALTNLIFNAVDAMPEGGILTLRTRRIAYGPEDRDRKEPSEVCIEVSDTGNGMDEETRRRCLEPFFTTKGERGTGLGLAMVYGMAQRHSAEIEIESEPGRGSTIRLIFPTYALDDLLSQRDHPAPAATRRLRILLIDDDPVLIEALQATINSDGHTTIAAIGGQAGIEAFSAAVAAGQSFDIVITDLGMPHVDGRKVAAAIKALSECTPVIMVTGWGHRLIAEDDIPPHVDRVLNKPPRMHELRATLAELTAGNSSPGHAAC